MEKEQMTNGGDEKAAEETSKEVVVAESAAAGKPTDAPATDADQGATPKTEEEEEDRLVLLADVLKEVDQYEEDARAVLGGSDETNCSYAADPPRQALYACKTCEMKVRDPATGEKHLAGVCLACSNQCHDGHDLVELYTKRNFTCDCGTDKFASPDFVCKLFDKRGLLNEGNKYNHNFVGLYCTCNRPYPDEEDNVDDCMLQCGICEDWFHGRHLQKSGQPLKNPLFFETICQQCVTKNSFLMYYLLEGGFEDVCSMDGETAKEADIDKEPITAASTSKIVEGCHQTESMDSGIQESSEGDNSSSNKPEGGSCKLAKFKASYLAKNANCETIPDAHFGPLFFTAEWRHLLCQCPACLEHYDHLEVPFITQLEDMTSFYEANGLKSVEEREEQAFANLPHVVKVELMQNLHGFKERLGQFLNSFSGGTEAITKRHVEEFFEGEYRRRDARKRQRTDGVPPSECGSAGR